DEITALLDDYAAHGVCNILALAGDPPADGSDPGGDFTYAIELVELVRAHPGDFSVGVAAHPELHPRSRGDREADRRHLAEKLSLADFAITQFFYDVDDYLRMLDELAALGCEKPVLPGVMPPGAASLSGLKRMAAMNGSVIPADRSPGSRPWPTTSPPCGTSASRWPPTSAAGCSTPGPRACTSTRAPGPSRCCASSTRWAWRRPTAPEAGDRAGGARRWLPSAGAVPGRQPRPIVGPGSSTRGSGGRGQRPQAHTHGDVRVR